MILIWFLLRGWYAARVSQVGYCPTSTASRLRPDVNFYLTVMTLFSKPLNSVSCSYLRRLELLASVQARGATRDDGLEARRAR